MPEPDKYGTYWLTSPKAVGGKEVPSPWAIFRSKRLICGVVSECDCWYLLAGEHGIVWDGPAPRWFLSVAAAFREAARLGFQAIGPK